MMGVPVNVRESGTDVRVTLRGAPPMALGEDELRRLSRRVGCPVPKNDAEARDFARALLQAQEQVNLPKLRIGSQSAGKPRPTQASYRFKGHLHPLDRAREKLRRAGVMKTEANGVIHTKSEAHKEWPTKAELCAAAAKKDISCTHWNPDKGILKFECVKQRHAYTGGDTAWFSKQIEDVMNEFGLTATEIIDTETAGSG